MALLKYRRVSNKMHRLWIVTWDLADEEMKNVGHVGCRSAIKSIKGVQPALVIVVIYVRFFQLRKMLKL